MLAVIALVTACGGGGGSASSESPQSAQPQTQPGMPAGEQGEATPPPSPPDEATTPTPPSSPPPDEQQPEPVDPSDPVDPIEPGEAWQPPADTVSRTRDALRFLNQSTFGATKPALAEIQAIGYDAYLDKQFGMPRTGYNGFTYLRTSAPADCRTDPNAKGSPQNICARDHYTLYEVQRQFFVNATRGEDQLRQRVAFALSQIFVVSGTEIDHAAGMASYQNMLLDNAFGNYRELLEAVTLHPVMGAYLDMVNNAQATSSRQANENYARECLQLFSIGTQRLNADGSVRVDGSGTPLPAYDQAVVGALAQVFTGWTFAPWDEAASQWPNPSNLVEPMIAIDAQHDRSAKTLFDGITLPAGQGAQQDLEAALDAISQHPNVGPFIGKRLIQHLVTSNPTPAYVARVSAVFADNGASVRGDLRSVVRAILLDPEARGSREDAADFGRLKDPALFLTSFVRGTGASSDGVYLRSQASLMGQNIFTPPSVFSYYSPSNMIRGTQLLGPEFGIYDSNRALLRAEFAYRLLYDGGVAPADTVADSIGTHVDIAALAALATDTSKLLDELDVRLMSRPLSPAARQIVANALDGDEEARARMALYLIAVSPQFQVQR